jgi:hypothetical protein
MKNLILFFAAIFWSGFLTGTLPALFLIALVECKYHKFEKWAERIAKFRGRAVSPSSVLVAWPGHERTTSPPRKAPQKAWRRA